MRVLIIGAGTMGLSHGWLLSGTHDVTFLVRDERTGFYDQNFELHLHDLRPHQRDRVCQFHPALAGSIDIAAHDIILVMVDRPHLSTVLPILKPLASRLPVVFMLNHWDIRAQLDPVLPRSTYLLGFPSQIGGGRDGHRLDVTVFPRGTVLETPTPTTHEALITVRNLFESAGLSVRWQPNMTDWMAVHSIQQALTAAPVLEAGSYEAFSRNPTAVGALVRAFREGLRVCRGRGIATWRIWPTPLFLLPTPIVTRLMQAMFQQPETTTMVTGHMRHGLQDWIAGLDDLHATAKQLGLQTPELDHHHDVLVALSRPR